ncbi:MAG: GDSL-type esterase/lipase family protein [Cyanobacteria bacterium P01_A01_bin.114]
MSDLLMLMSQLLTYEPLQPWELDLDDPSAETTPHLMLADSSAQPQVADAVGLNAPEFSRALQSRKRLLRLQRTAGGVGSAAQAAHPPLMQPSGLTAPAMATPVAETATGGLQNEAALRNTAKVAAGDPAGTPSVNAANFDFSDVNLLRPDSSGRATPLSSGEFATPTAASLSPDRILSYATTPQALALAMQRVTAPQGPRPSSGPQLYQQRQMALQAGSLYTRLAPESFQVQWSNAKTQPTYEQWKGLLAREAGAIAKGQGSNRLTVVVGDSLSLWLPPELLPRDRFWLNQGISGDTTHGVLNRLSSFEQTRPDVIHVMAGVNDLKNGASSAEVLTNLQSIMQRLRQQHPEARIVVHSILPTRLASIPSDRIRALNAQIAQSAQAQGVVYLDLHPSFTDEVGNLRYELTTDGIHLSRLGYQVWQIAMLAV